MRCCLALVLTAGCSFQHSVGGDGGGGGGDDGGSGSGSGSGSGIVDAMPPDAIDPSSCLGHWMTHDVHLTAPKLLQPFDFVGYERDPFLTADDKKLYVSTDVYTPNDKDLYSTTRTLATDAFPDQADEEPGLDSNATDEKLAIGGGVAILASSRTGGPGGIDLFEATVDANGAFGTFAAGNLSKVNAANVDDHDPWLSADGLRLYYAPYVLNTNVQHVKLATRNALGQKFDAPTDVPLMEPGNTGDPFLANHETLILYAAGGNLHYATRATSGDTFGVAQVITDADSTSVDGDPILTSDGCTLIFSSDRLASDFDIWTADLMR